jgi:site-specific DNA-methyltransferase (adenine-specific)
MRVESFMDGRIRLILGDCLDVLPTIGRADHVITDPPYEKEAHKVGRRTQASIKRGVNADLDFAAITEDIRSEVARLTTQMSDGWAIYFCQAEAAGSWRDALEAAGAKYKRTMVWIKPDSTPQLNGQMPAPGYESMPLAWCGKGHSHWNGGGRRGVFTHMTNQTDRHGVHPTEKPISLMAELIGLFSDPDQLICDPFMGSCSTGIACIKRGRRFVGIERDPKYFEVACERVDFAARQPDMFGEFQPRSQIDLLPSSEAAE